MLSVYYSQHLGCGKICLKGYMEDATVMHNESFTTLNLLSAAIGQLDKTISLAPKT